MLASPRLDDGVRAFFSDMLQLDDLSLVSKDHILYPNFSPDVIADAREETLRTITDVLVRRNADFREIYTTKHTFLTPLLGSVYRVPVTPHGLNGTANPWEAYDYPADSPQSGILTQVSFVALHSEPGRSSPTERGRAVREILLCQKVPNPPANVSFKIVQDTSNPIYRTARARLEAHHTNPVCAGCHKLIDPLGYPLENFDSAGAFRLTENGVAIDASGKFDGQDYSNTQQFAQIFAKDPAASSCMVNRLYAYAMGSPIGPDNKDTVAALNKEFVAYGYRFMPLLRRIATSEEFYSASGSNVLSAMSN